MKKPFRLLIILLTALTLNACGKSETPVTDDITITATPTGTLRVVFKITHPWLPVNRIVRTQLNVGLNGTEIYKGNYIQSANVTSFQEEYNFTLEPGTYYYEAVTACICDGDSCSAGGFPGNKWGTKSTMGKFTIVKDQVTQIVPSFK